MTTAYTTILKLALPVQGELSGTWGDVVNDNITQMVEQAVAGKAVVNTWTGNSHTLTTADGTTSESRCAILELTDSGTALTGAGTVVCPTNTKLYIVDNNTAEIVTIKTSGGTGVAVPVGKTMLVYCDGTNVVEGVTHANSLSLGTSTSTVNAIDTATDLGAGGSSNSNLPTQLAVKTYVDGQIAATNELSEVLAAGNTTGGTDLAVSTGDDITFADSSKAIFGAGSDLQIYHSGTNSFIDDAGTGNLQIRGTQIKLQKYTGENMFVGISDGAASMYYDNAQKIATTATGIDVTGTVTADGLTVQGSSDSTILVEATGGNDASLFLTEAGTGIVGAQLVYDGGDNTLYVRVDNNGSKNRLSVSRDTGDISFYEDTGTTPKFFWDASAESLGIGNTSPATALDVTGTVTADGAVNSTYFIGGSSSVAGRQLTLSSEANGVQDNAIHRLTVPSGYGTFNVNVAGSERLVVNTTGIDITGTATMDGLVVDGNAVIDGGATDNTVLTLDSGTANTYLKMTDSNSTSGVFIGATTNDLNLYPNNTLSAKFSAGGDVSFYEDTGTTPKFFWDASAESLGIGTTTVNRKLEVAGNNNAGSKANFIRITDTDTSATAANPQGGIEFYTSDTGNENVTASIVNLYAGSGAGSELTFNTAPNGSAGVEERLRIDSSGNVGINAVPEAWDSAFSSVLQVGAMSVLTSGGDNARIFGNAYYDGGATYKRINTGYAQAYEQTTGQHRWYNAASGAADSTFTWAESMRIDASGNLLVGKTATDFATAGTEIMDHGEIQVTRAGVPMYLRRNSSDGDILSLYKDGTPVGSIGVSGGNNTYISGSVANHSGLVFATNEILPTNAGGAGTNGLESLGGSSNRFKDLYLSGGVYLGGTAAANLLDDYEEGAFTPTPEGLTTAGTISATGLIKIGSYVKVGRAVQFSLVVYGTTFTGTGDFSITGFPFTNNGSSGTFPCQANNPPWTLDSDHQNVTGYMPAASTTMTFRATDWNGGDTHLVAQCGGSTTIGYLRVTGVYYTNS